MRLRQLSLAGGVAAAAVSPAAVFGQSTNVLVATGDAAPDGNGTFVSFGVFDGPSLNDAGQVGFAASLGGTAGGSLDASGVFRAGVGGVVQVARGGQAVPGGGDFFVFSGPAINESGQLAFAASGLVAAGGFRGIYRGDGAGAPVQIVRDGQATPGGNGTFINFNGPAFNDAGQVAFFSQLAGTTGGAANTDNLGVFRGDGTGTPTQIARRGQPTPGGNGTLDTFGFPAINATGQAAFAASLANTSGGLSDSSGVYRGDGVAAPVQVARQGQTVPGANGTFARFSFANPALNDAGQAAFRASLDNTLGGTGDNEAIYRGDGATPVIQVAREGQMAPGGGRFAAFGFDPALNEANQVAFFAGLRDTPGGTTDDAGLFRAGGAGGTVTVVRKGQAAPGGDGTFSVITDNAFALNDAGQIAFVAALAGTSGGNADDGGLFLYDDALGLLTVAREGDALLGSTIIDLRFNAGTIYAGDERSGLNEVGQVAYGFTLADGRRGIALYDSTPEPGSLALLGLAGVALVRRRRN